MEKYIINETTMYIKAYRDGRSIYSEIGEFGKEAFVSKRNRCIL